MNGTTLATARCIQVNIKPDQVGVVRIANRNFYGDWRHARKVVTWFVNDRGATMRSKLNILISIMADAVGRIDELVTEYLLYRGFHSAAKLLEADSKNARDKGLRVCAYTF